MKDGDERSKLFYQFEMVRNGEWLKPVLHLDTERYAHHLQGLGLSEEQEQEVLEEVWNLILAFVELGFCVHPLQLACGQLEKTLDRQGQEDSDDGYTKTTNSNEKFDNAPER